MIVNIQSESAHLSITKVYTEVTFSMPSVSSPRFSCTQDLRSACNNPVSILLFLSYLSFLGPCVLPQLLSRVTWVRVTSATVTVICGLLGLVRVGGWKREGRGAATRPSRGQLRAGTRQWVDSLRFLLMLLAQPLLNSSLGARCLLHLHRSLWRRRRHRCS